MIDTRFRQLLIASAALLVSALVAGFLPGGYSQALGDAYAGEPMPWLMANEGVAIVVVLMLLMAALVGFVGLFLLKRWGRTVSVTLTVVFLPVHLLLGPTLTSPLEATFAEASTLLWGACLALAYFSPIARRIETGAASE